MTTHTVEQKLIKQLEDSGNYRVLKRFEPIEQYQQVTDQALKTCIFLDVETTGLDANLDKVIELAMVPFECDSHGQIYRVLDEYHAFQDPGMPIPASITELTGISDDMVRGQAIDMQQVAQMLSTAVLIIAHNARFDRPFMENLYTGFEEKYWACSIADVDWSSEGLTSAKLDYLAYQFGFFYDAHRATIDCLVGIHILTQILPKSAVPVMNKLLQSARRSDIRLWAVAAPFDKKDILRKRGYRWSNGDDGSHKAWYTDIAEAELDAEIDYLNNEIFQVPVNNLPTKKIAGQLRYSTRI